MKIIFDKRPGKIYDLFTSLWVASNYDYVKEISKSLGIDRDTKFDKTIYSIIKDEKINMKKLKKYFYRELEPNNMLSLSNIWKYPTIDKYLEFMRNVDEFEIRKKMTKLIMILMKDETSKNTIEKIASDNSSVLNYINDKEINPGLKWEIFSLLNNKQKYLDDFTEFINEYLDTYKILDKERKKIISKFNIDFEENINEFGLDFLNKVINYAYDFNKYEKIYVTTSVDIGLYIRHNKEEKSCYVVVGPRMKEIIEKMGGKNEIEKNLTIFKNISESTKFQIMKQIVEKDCYGLEIVETLGITKATVSHHMKQLILAGLVSVKRKGQKAYYSLNKDTMRRTTQYLIDEFKL